MKLKKTACIALVAWLPFAGTVAQAQDTIKIGVIAALSGPFANIGKPFEDGIKTYMQQHGDSVAGKKIEVIYRDDGGSNSELSKRAAQELVAREKVNFLNPTLEALGDRALGAVTVLNYSTALDNEANKSFLKAYAAANPNRPAPTFVTVAAYDTIGMIYETVRKLNGNVTGDGAMKVLTGMTWESPRGPISIDPSTRDIVQNMYIREVKKVNGKLVNQPISVLKDVAPN